MYARSMDHTHIFCIRSRDPQHCNVLGLLEYHTRYLWIDVRGYLRWNINKGFFDNTGLALVKSLRHCFKVVWIIHYKSTCMHMQCLIGSSICIVMCKTDICVCEYVYMCIMYMCKGLYVYMCVYAYVYMYKTDMCVCVYMCISFSGLTLWPWWTGAILIPYYWDYVCGAVQPLDQHGIQTVLSSTEPV